MKRIATIIWKDTLLRFANPMEWAFFLIMPVMFTFFFLNMSSGLTVYFLFSNVFGMMFQLALQKWTPDLVKPAAAVAKKR